MDSNTVSIYHHRTTYRATYEVHGDYLCITSPPFNYQPIRAIKGLPHEIQVRQYLRQVAQAEAHPHKENPPG